LKSLASLSSLRSVEGFRVLELGIWVLVFGAWYLALGACFRHVTPRLVSPHIFQKVDLLEIVLEFGS